MLNIAGYNISLNSANGTAFEIYFQGCRLRCKGCHNPELQEFKSGIYFEEEIISLIEERKDFVEWVCLLGGEALDQDLDDLYSFITDIKQIFPKISVKLYSGYRESEILGNKKREKCVSICEEYYLGRYGERKESLVVIQKL